MANDPQPEVDVSLSSSGGLGYFASAFGFRGGIVGASFATALPGDPSLPNSTTFGDLDIDAQTWMQASNSETPPGTTFEFNQLGGDRALGIVISKGMAKTQIVPYSNWSYILDPKVLWDLTTEYHMGALQGAVNSVQSVQDGLVSLANTPAFVVNNFVYWSDWSNEGTSDDLYLPYFESYQWAKGLITETDDTTYEASKLFGGFGVSALVAPEALVAKGLGWLPKVGGVFRGFRSGGSVVDDVGRQANRTELPVYQEWCFAPETLVDTPNGRRRIDEIREGDDVLAFDFDRGQWVRRIVQACHRSQYLGAMIEITTERGTVEATAYHPFWVIEGYDLANRPRPRELAENEDEGLSLPGRWVNSHDLLAGDLLASADGRQLRVLRISQRYEESFAVCNLTIDTNHSFAVGNDGILVHNTGGCGIWGTSAPRGALELGGFAKAITADEIAAINSRLGGSLLQGSPTSALAAAARQEGFFNKSAALIRSIVKNHTFTDANKRTAQQVFEALKASNGVTTGVSSAETRRIIQQIAEGKLDDVAEIAKLLRGF